MKLTTMILIGTIIGASVVSGLFFIGFNVVESNEHIACHSAATGCNGIHYSNWVK